MKLLKLLVIVLAFSVSAGIARAQEEGGGGGNETVATIHANVEWDTPANDGDYYHVDEEIVFKTKNHWVKLVGQTNFSYFSVGWQMNIFINNQWLTLDLDSAANQTILTNASGVWIRNAHNVGYCQYTSVPYQFSINTGNYALPYALMHFSQIGNEIKNTPSRTFHIIP
jgi:hypothetical protein